MPNDKKPIGNRTSRKMHFSWWINLQKHCPEQYLLARRTPLQGFVVNAEPQLKLFTGIQMRKEGEEYRLNEDGDSYRIVGGDERMVSLANEFLRACDVRRLSSMTVRSYGYDLVFILRWLGGLRIRFSKINKSHLLHFINYQNERKAQPASINRRLATISIFYQYAYNRRVPSGPRSIWRAPHYRKTMTSYVRVVHNIARRSALNPSVRNPRKVLVALTDDEVKALMTTLTRHRDRAIFQLMLMSGLRSHEVLELPLPDLDLDGQRVRVIGKGRKERFVPISDLCTESLQKYLRYERPHNSEHSLFVVLQGTRLGSPMTKAGLRSLFRCRRRRLAIRNAHPHRLRHTFALNMVKEHVSLPALQKLLGHGDPRVTERYITMSLTDVQDEYRRAVKKMKERYGRKN